ncbi:MAG: tetratricopeptide repeat protein [Alphaproteobacteria bacterium]|nr:tetratricopeptide repeat protein [Alphaproteobacteria bacterium]
MFVKKLLLSVCVLSFFSFNQTDAGLREDLSKKKYSFSEPVLNEVECLNRIVMRGDNPEEVFQLMWEDVLNGNEKVQKQLKKIFSNPLIYQKAKDRVPLLNDIQAYSLDILIDIGVDQQKSWAFYEKAMKENDPKQRYIFSNEAFNHVDLAEDPKIVESYGNSIDKNEHPICTSINYEGIKCFIEKCKNLKSGNYLYENYNYYKDSTKKIQKDFSFKCLIASADIGFPPACHDLVKIYENQKDYIKKKKYLLKLIENGHEHSMCCLAETLMQSASISDKKEAVSLLLRAAEKTSDNEVVCMSTLYAGSILKDIAENSTDKIKALNLLMESEKLNDVVAMRKLGEIYIHGYLDDVSNFDEAAKFFMKAAKKEDPVSMYYYGLILKTGFDNQEPDKNKGDEWILKAANLACLPAMNYVSGSFFCKFGNEKNVLDLKEAYKWFLKASELNDQLTLYNLGRILLYGFSEIEADSMKAEKCLLKAADMGNVESIIVLAHHYIHKAQRIKSKGNKNKFYNKSYDFFKKVEESDYFSEFFISDKISDDEKKLENFSKKNSSNFRVPIFCFSLDKKEKINSLYIMAECYYKKFLNNKDNQLIKKAYQFCLCAAKNGHLAAMYRVASMLLDDVAFEKQNLKKALKWFLRAAEKDHMPSMVELAKLFIFSPELNKIDKNLKDALFWLQKANAMGDADAGKYLEICEKLLNEKNESDLKDNDLLDFIEKQEELSLDLSGLMQAHTMRDITENNLNALNKVIEENQVEEDVLTVVFQEKDNNLIEDAVNESWEISKVDSLNIIEKKQEYNNPKYKREQLQAIGLLIKNQEKKENDRLGLELSNNNKLIVNMLLDKKIKSKNIDYTQLVNLFSDSFF